MDYREIVAVTGMGGLFQLMATKSDGAIVKNLADKSMKFIPARLHNVTPLETIEIYTTGHNVRLHEVLEAIKQYEASNTLANHKSADNNEIKACLKAAFPSIDEDRVYVSDMKKILRWYEILKSNDLLNFEMYQENEATQEADAAATETATEEQPAPKKAKKATKKAEVAEGEEAPKKKVATKKKAAKAEGEEDAPKAPKKTATKKATKDAE